LYIGSRCNIGIAKRGLKQAKKKYQENFPQTILSLKKKAVNSICFFYTQNYTKNSNLLQGQFAFCSFW
jgi:hypothetical protein